MKKAQTVRRIALGVFGAIILFIIVVVFIRQRKSKINTFDENDEENGEYDDEYDDEEVYDKDIENDYEKKIEKSDEELFRRVNKSKFKPVNDDTNILKINDEQINKQSNEEEDNKEIMDNYFRNLDTKRKGKHF